jgi:hypothetical protein
MIPRAPTHALFSNTKLSTVVLGAPAQMAPPTPLAPVVLEAVLATLLKKKWPLYEGNEAG